MKPSSHSRNYFSYQDLLNRKSSLGKECNRLEADMKERAGYLKKNYLGLAVNSLFPKGSGKYERFFEGIKSLSLRLFGEGTRSSFLESTLSKSLQWFLARQFSRLFSRSWHRKKKETRDPGTSGKEDPS